MERLETHPALARPRDTRPPTAEPERSPAESPPPDEGPASSARSWLPTWLSRVGPSEGRGDRAFRAVTCAFALSVVVLIAAMAIQMTRASALALQHFGAGFLLGQKWDPVAEEFGALPFLFGTVASSLLALTLAVPVSLGVAVFLSELAPGWVRRPLGLLVELLAAIPSVVYGLWGMFVLVPWLAQSVGPSLASAFGSLPFFSGVPRGFGMLAGGLILAIMILPTVASVSRDVMSAVNVSQREAALALGATRWETVRMAVLPEVARGLIGAVILGLGRALGETMAVTMVIGNRAEISASLFSPAATMASVVANEYTEATGDLYLSALSALGLLLFLVTLLLNLIARILVMGVGRRTRARRA